MAITKIIDATLREGNQAPGVAFTVEASVIIAQLLQKVGVDIVECGHAGVSEFEASRIRAVSNLGLPVLGHSRAVIEDVDRTADAGAQWVGIFAGINTISRESRLSSRSEIDVINMVCKSVAHAKKRGLKVRYTIEDASRTSDDAIFRVIDQVLREGVDRICYADTLGIFTPSQVTSKILSIRTAYPDIDIETHFHDDRGMAIANSLSAVNAGASWVSTSVNGLGERCGITDLMGLIGNLIFEGETGRYFDMQAAQELSRYVGAISRCPPDARRPVVGRNAFTHTSRLHTVAMTRNRKAYEWQEPEQLGRKTDFATLPDKNIDRFVVIPKTICASELRYHRSGPGTRYVFIDDRFVEDARQYCIIREIPHQQAGSSAHVDSHRHTVDSLWMFVGKNEDLSGLVVEIDLDGYLKTLESPAAVHIPAGMLHKYSIISGEGYYINHVQSGLYQESLLETHNFISKLNGSVENDQNEIIGPNYETFKSIVVPFVAKKLGISTHEVDDKASLLSNGEIDSINMIELILLIEENWSADLMLSGFEPSKIGSIESLFQYLKNNLMIAA